MAANSISEQQIFSSQDKHQQHYLEDDKSMNENFQTEMDNTQELQRCKTWLQEQQIDCNTQLIKCRLDQEQALQPFSTDDDISILNERISKLQEDLLKCSSTKSYVKVIHDRLLEGDTLIKTLFPHTVMESPSQDELSKMNDIAKLCETNNDLCSTILEHHQDLKQVQQKLDEVRQKNFEIKAVNRELMSKLKTLKERKDPPMNLSSEDDTVKEADKRYHHARSKLNLTANIFQALIVGSGINWAADDRTRELVVSLGEID